jgi:hypothetical protein
VENLERSGPLQPPEPLPLPDPDPDPDPEPLPLVEFPPPPEQVVFWRESAAVTSEAGHLAMQVVTLPTKVEPQIQVLSQADLHLAVVRPPARHC